MSSVLRASKCVYMYVLRPTFEAVTGGHFVMFLQHYTPMVKGMKDKEFTDSALQ